MSETAARPRLLAGPRTCPQMTDRAQALGVSGPGRRPQSPRGPGERDGDHQADAEHHQAQEPQAAAETVGHALERHEATEDPARLLLEGRPAQPSLVEVV